MSDDAPAIAYATSDLEPTADRLLRWIVAITAIAHGGTGILSVTLHAGLALGWLASPSGMSWGVTGVASTLIMAGLALAAAAMVLAGVLILKRSTSGIVIVRAAAAATLLMTLANTAHSAYAYSAFAPIWSTPASAMVFAAQTVRELWVPVLLTLLTLPPLAHRIA